MAQIALPRQQVTQTPPSAGIGSPLYQRRGQSNTGPIELLPNPDFSFPMRDPDSMLASSAPESSARPMSLQAYPTGRRGSTPGMRMKSVSTLPDFSFNPAESATGTSPPHSPLKTPTTPSRPIGGHRRGGSEFIGGDGRTGGTTLLSTSPTKGDGVLPAPSTNLHPGLPTGRRGHAHRRSGAVSSHDLSSIMNPPAQRSGSAPVTPAEGAPFAFGHSVNKSMSQPSLRDASSFVDESNSTPRPPSRARVGFSDKVEYIRPLSTISSETETSMSTFRGHSATNSLSSVVSGTSSPQSARTGRPLLGTTAEDESRPSTAGAVLDMQRGSCFGEDTLDSKRPSSAILPTSIASPTSPTIPAKRRSFFRLESRRSDPSVRTLSTASDPALSASLDSPLPSPMLVDDDTAEGTEKQKSRKSSRAPRKVKSWASSIIPKKSKHSKKGKCRAPTPPAETGEDLEDTDASDDMDFDAIFDADNTVTIVSPTKDSTPDVKAPTDYSSWQPREFKRVDSDTMTPVIDLDAALGPFNTPHGTSPRGAQRGFAAHRRAMHSAGGLVQTHRRTESAPELVPFEFRNTAVAAPKTMADVFEEDEPEDETSGPRHKTKADQETHEEDEEPKIQVVETDGNQSGSAINWNFNDGLGIKREKTTRPDSEPTSPHSGPQHLPSIDDCKRESTSTPVEVVEDFEEPRTSSLTHSSDSTVTPQLAPIDTKDSQAALNFSLPLPQQNLMTPDTITSSFTSPDFRSSQLSFDTPRLGTAASSMTDYPAMPSPRFGEPGPELRVSVDDVPSLTSSRSTMTSAMQSAFPLASPRRPGDRSASLCSVPSEGESRRRKRSSIASLSRLINGSSFGERSKLSIETRPASEYLEPSHKESKKKHKRLSKLMQFWKPKDPSRN
ncbi:hypothetical protein K458DRAFT_201943 [Lentithecium fluviatile CBS 122367]|uniref:Cell wall proline rich protein n=1 Tax=Lentithecium fluviatile CBS 122367 TaxID=1168545 RepID=A0A6G1J911_9PLEO|nr:hypothetical protein K458DRAFT_201943 [Lentithecium fluviatile CBS 122367]